MGSINFKEGIEKAKGTGEYLYTKIKALGSTYLDTRTRPRSKF